MVPKIPNSVAIRGINAQAAKAVIPAENGLSVSKLPLPNNQASVSDRVGPEENTLRNLIDSTLSVIRSEGLSSSNSKPGNDKKYNLPDGTYDTTVDGRYFPTRKGTPRYLLRHTIANGEFVGVTLWQDLYLTDNGAWYSLPILFELGLDSYEAIRNTAITGVSCETTIITEEQFSGKKKNVVQSFVVVGDQPSVSSVCPPPDGDDDFDSDDLLEDLI